MAADPEPEREELFPATHPAVREWLDAGDHRELNRHIMAVYHEPLRRYLRGSPTFRAYRNDRGLSAAAADDWIDDVLNGFFAARLARRDYLAEWAADGRRLNAWLRRGLWFFLREHWRDENRLLQWLPREDALLEVEATAEFPGAELDRRLVLELVREAMETARRACEQRGFGQHWQVLSLHLFEERSHRDLAKELGVAPDRAPVMLRTAVAHFRRAFEALIRRQARSPELFQRTIDQFLEALE